MRFQAAQIEQLVDEPILLANIIVADPPRLPLADHVHSLVSRNRSPCCSELAKREGARGALHQQITPYSYVGQEVSAKGTRNPLQT